MPHEIQRVITHVLVNDNDGGKPVGVTYAPTIEDDYVMSPLPEGGFYIQPITPTWVTHVHTLGILMIDPLDFEEIYGTNPYDLNLPHYTFNH